MSKINKQQQITELEAKLSELTAGWQRTQADFINYKKQAEESRGKLISSANSELLSELLPVLDNFQLAAKHLPAELNENNWAQGIKQVEKQFEAILFEAGLTRIDSMGQHFNPELHEAIEEVDSEQPDGTIVEEVSTGYKFNDNVLRPGKVKVAKKKI